MGLGGKSGKSDDKREKVVIASIASVGSIESVASLASIGSNDRASGVRRWVSGIGYQVLGFQRHLTHYDLRLTALGFGF